MVIELLRKQDFEQLLEHSTKDPVVILKHSTRCAVSDAALDEFHAFSRSADDIPCGIVLVIEHQDVSNAIAQTLNVRHQSPQVILVHDRQPKWNASHWAITAETLRDALLRTS
jgi:bacillithiol system protein YtxJ